MKKYGMIFASVISTLAIMLIPNHEVRADTFVHNNSKYDIDEILEYIKNYNSDYTIENYPYISIHPLDNGFNFYMISNKNNFCYDKAGNRSDSSDFVCTYTDDYFLKINGSYATLSGYYGVIKAVYDSSTDTYTITRSSGSGSNFYFPGSLNAKESYYSENGTLKGFYDSRIIYSNFSFYDITNDYNEYFYYSDFVSGIHTFNELVSTSKYGGLIFTFDTSNYEKYLEYNSLLFNYSFYSSDINYNLLDYSFEVPYFGYNGKDVYSDGSETYSYHVDKLGYDLKNIYEESYNKSMKYFVSELKLFVYFDTLDDIYVSAYLDSLIPFEVEYLPKNSNSNYYKSVDITGKYGVMLKPNQTIDDYVSMIYFENGGKYSLQVRDNYSSTNDDFNIVDYYQIGFCNTLDVVGLVPIHCANNNFVSINNYLSYDKQYVYVRNENYYKSNITSIVYYDSRYYTAYVQNTSSSSIEIVNPETGETEIFGPMTNFDDIYYEKMNDKFLVFFKNAFNEFKSVIVDIFLNVSYFFDNLSVELQYFYIVVFSLIIFIFLIRFLL